MHPYKINLPEKDIPKAWYNVVADLPFPLSPPMHPGTKKPLKKEDLQQIFPDVLIEQEMSAKRWIAIPDEVIDIYRLWRPTPLRRAYNLEKFLKTKCRIYYKDESSSPIGSHKANTSVPQAYYNKKAGIKRISTETGAGQWGSALAMAGQLFDISVEVYMVNSSYLAKPYRRIIMQTYGAQIVPSPSAHTKIGQSYLEKDPNHPGSLGIAIYEAVEVAAESGGQKKYGLGSVLNHVLLHQTVIGEEAIKQMDLAGEYPDVVIGCVGGGSNFSGIAFPFLRHNLKDGKHTRFLAVEPTSTPSLTRGVYGFDYGDSAGIVPILKMYTLGSDFVPDPIHAGGLRYHGMSPIVSSLYNQGLIEAVAVGQRDVFSAAIQFARAEGILPAPESSHAIRAAINEAIDAREKGEKRVILFNLSGHGFLDLSAYDQYLHNGMIDGSVSNGQLSSLAERLPQVSLP